MEATVFLGKFNAAEIIWEPSPDLSLDTILSRSSTDNSFDLMAWFFIWNALSTVGPYIDRCVPFQIMSNQLNLPQVDSNQLVETSMIINGNRMHMSSISSLMAKGLNTYVHKVLFFYFPKFDTFYKKPFTLSIWGTTQDNGSDPSRRAKTTTP